MKITGSSPCRGPIEETKNPLSPGHGGEGLVVLIAKDLNGAEEDVGEEKEANQVAGSSVICRRLTR